MLAYVRLGYMFTSFKYWRNRHVHFICRSVLYYRVLL